jgi:hypothetical protein
VHSSSRKIPAILLIILSTSWGRENERQTPLAGSASVIHSEKNGKTTIVANPNFHCHRRIVYLHSSSSAEKELRLLPLAVAAAKETLGLPAWEKQVLSATRGFRRVGRHSEYAI